MLLPAGRVTSAGATSAEPREVANGGELSGTPVRLADLLPDSGVSREITLLREALAGTSVGFPPLAVQVKPATAAVIARFDDERRSPAMLLNRYGRGRAILVTAPETGFDKGDPFWRLLRKLTIGKPTLACDPKIMDRYRIILTKVEGKHALHVIDRAAAEKQGSRGMGPAVVKKTIDYHAGDVELALIGERLGGVKEVRLVGAKDALPLGNEGGLVTFTVKPDPVASVLLK